MRLLVSKFWNRLRRQFSDSGRPRATRRLQCEALEDRCLMATASGTITGVTYMDTNHNNTHDAAETKVQGISVNLTGATALGAPVNFNAVTDSSGTYTFQNVLPGTYAVNAAANQSVLPNGESSASGLKIVGGDTITRDLGFSPFVAPRALTLRLFLASSTSLVPAFDPAGPGTTLVNSRPDNAPTVTPFSNVTLSASSPDSALDLTKNFTDPDLSIPGSNEKLTFSLVSNTNPAVINASVTGSTLNVHLVSGQLGSSTVTVQATDAFGASVQATILVSTNLPPTISTNIAPVSVAQNAANTVLDLSGNFTDPNLGETTVQFQTTDGPVNVDLFDAQAPRTVANFLNYVTSGRFGNTVFHRNAINPDGSEFVLQGGGFSLGSNPTALNAVTVDPAVQNEFSASRSNLLGTLAMAKQGGDPNSATSQFFFNLGNNSANLDNQNGGFTVFGKLDSAADQSVVNNLASIPVNVVQTITFGGTPTGGTFNLVFKGVTSSAITFDPTASTLQANIQNALNAMSTVGSGNATVTAIGSSSTSGFRVTFQGTLNTAIPLMSANSSLTGTSPTVTVNAREASPFDEIPLANYTGTNFPTDTTAANYAMITSATIINQPEKLTYSVVSNSNTGLVTATINNERLTLAYTANTAGTATITVRATDKSGATVDDTFTVTVT